MNRLLVVGNGMASVRLLEELLRLGVHRYAITVVGAEPSPGYNRVQLSALLAGDLEREQMALRPLEWYETHHIRLITGDPVTKIDTKTKIASLGSGARIGFDKCIFATGSTPLKLAIPGINLPGVRAFRDLDDVQAMQDCARGDSKIVVIGGGLLGIEAAYGIARRGAHVTLVHVMDRLMERQLDAPAAALLRKALERRGVRVLLKTSTVAIEGENKVTGVRFADGSKLEASHVICAIGIRPNAALAQTAGIETRKGIIVDDLMRTNLAEFYAIGECAEHRGVIYGLVEPAYAQARALALHLAGLDEPFLGMSMATNLKTSGIPVFSAGEFLDRPGAEIVTLYDRARGVYRKCVIAEGRLVGCILVGDSDDASWYLDLLRSGVEILPARNLLVHGRAFAGPLICADAVEKAA